VAIVAPAVGAPVLAMISRFPHGDWRIGAPFYFCSLLQAMALVLAAAYFRRERQRAASPSPVGETVA
jgi:DHA1 family tetracycline resistance protein-like MFS transporter